MVSVNSKEMRRIIKEMDRKESDFEAGRKAGAKEVWKEVLLFCIDRIVADTCDKVKPSKDLYNLKAIAEKCLRDLEGKVK